MQPRHHHAAYQFQAWRRSSARRRLYCFVSGTTETLEAQLFTDTTISPSPIAFYATISGSMTIDVPAVLPLFATGLGALGLLGWRRKRAAAG
jgi:hypothetical protein